MRLSEWRFHLGHAADPQRDFGYGRNQRTFAKAGADAITVHYEVSPHLHRTLTQIRALDCRSGAAKFWAYAITACFLAIPGGPFWVAAAVAAGA